MRKSRLGQFKQHRLIEHFVASSRARTACALVGVNFKSAAYFFRRLRGLIALELERQSTKVVDGEIEVDESYFDGRRKGRCRRAAAGKVPVFGLLKGGVKVYTKIIADASRCALSLKVKWCLTVSSIVTVGVAIMGWM